MTTTEQVPEQLISEPKFEPGLPGLEPSIEMPQKVIAIHLIGKEDLSKCSFWIGLFNQGKLTPKELLDFGNINEIFSQAATKGITEAGPLMISDSSSEPARYIFLLPEPNAELASGEHWISDLVATVKSWAPAKAGVYLAPELLEKRSAHDLLLRIMRELVLSTGTREFFLFPGAHGVNAVLNSALHLKEQMESDGVTVYVFH